MNTIQPVSLIIKTPLLGLISLLLSTSILLTVTGCGGDSNNSSADNETDLTAEFAQQQEVDRLRYFREIKVDNVRKNNSLTGKGVRVTIMGEIVDAAHPDLQNRVMQQFNTFSQKGSVIPGVGNQPHALEYYGRDSGHGTHIAGTIAAECDGMGVQGVACGALLDVYDIGAYGNESVPTEGWGDVHQFERILGSFTAAINDVQQRGLSRIATGSFNIEAPAIVYKSGGPFENQSITQIINHIEVSIDDVDDLLAQNSVDFENPEDQVLLTRLVENNGGDIFIIAGTLLSKSSEWKALETAIDAYQSNDGVYIVTESNYLFENHTSILNAMPNLSDKVDSDLWISAVMAQPEGYDEVRADPDTTADDVTALMNGKYITPLNSCGVMAADYCILIPSYDVLSTMTKRFADDSGLFLIDDRIHQIYSGHSMGAPMIAAALALMEEHNQNNSLDYSMKDLVRILKDSAYRSFEGYNPNIHGRGLLDVAAAITAMQP